MPYAVVRHPKTHVRGVVEYQTCKYIRDHHHDNTHGYGSPGWNVRSMLDCGQPDDWQPTPRAFNETHPRVVSAKRVVERADIPTLEEARRLADSLTAAAAPRSTSEVL